MMCQAEQLTCNIPKRLKSILGCATTIKPPNPVPAAPKNVRASACRVLDTGGMMSRVHYARATGGMTARVRVRPRIVRTSVT